MVEGCNAKKGRWWWWEEEDDIWIISILFLFQFSCEYLRAVSSFYVFENNQNRFFENSQEVWMFESFEGKCFSNFIDKQRDLPFKIHWDIIAIRLSDGSA